MVEIERTVMKKFLGKLNFLTGHLKKTQPSPETKRQPTIPPSRIAGEILESRHFAKDSGGSLHVYKDGRYQPGGAEEVKRQVKAVLKDWDKSHLWTGSKASDVVEYIRIDAPELWERPPSHGINVKNGLLEIETRKLLPHNHNWLSPIQLPVTFDPEATCPAWERFVREVFPEDAADLGWEIFGYLMTPRYVDSAGHNPAGR